MHNEVYKLPEFKLLLQNAVILKLTKFDQFQRMLL